ncbi:MAG TPA: serine/threonine-protein kinase [Gemmatimonadaceae bacterium]|nr:serine/threonine-protein kinase [Gemmatimonadaceae bacterium]
MSSDPSAAGPSNQPRISGPLVEALHDRYAIVRETGRGASATVYLARDLKHDRLVALKTLNPDVSPTAGERFLREISVAAGMQHPHILPMYDSGIADGRLYFVMPFVDGGSLRQRLEAEPRMPVRDALRAAHEIAIALAFAHDQGVVHRDVKPENILFYHGHACLADFGVARVMEQMDMSVTGHGMIVGTPAYMSPEQLTHGGFDGRSDVYSLACVLYESLAGVPAFAGSTPQELLRQRLKNPPEPLHVHRPDIPPFVDDLLMRALAPSPDARYPDARSFADAIEFTLRDLARPRRSGPQRVLHPMPRHPLAWTGAVVLVVGLSALAASPLRSTMASRRASSHSASSSSTVEHAMALEFDRRTGTDAYRLVAAQLTRERSQLHGRDSLRAEGLIALAERAYPRACTAFDRLRALDSLDAQAWFGLGDCTTLDSVVVPDASSPSRWRFRASWPTGVRAYRRATSLDPTIYQRLGYATLSRLLPTSATQLRGGRLATETGMTFLALPSMSGDTVAYIPYRVADFASGKGGTAPPSQPEALRENRETLAAFAREWVAAAPSNPDALEALASADESRGLLGDNAEGAESALRRARTASGSPEQSLRLATTEVRLRLKRGALDSARALADSLLASHLGPVDSLSIDAADRLAGLAAFTGRVDRAAALRARALTEQNASASIPPPLGAAAARFFERAAAGVCDDSLRAAVGGIDTLLESYTQPNRRDGVRAQLLARPMSIAYACLGTRAFQGLRPVTPLDRAERALAARNLRAAQSILDTLDTMRRAGLPGDVSLEFTVEESWVRAAAGDTLGAMRHLDRVLNALSTLGVYIVRDDAQAAAVGRALALRAELAAGAGDLQTQHRRAREALLVWRHADPALDPMLAHLRALAGPGNQ